MVSLNAATFGLGHHFQCKIFQEKILSSSSDFILLWRASEQKYVVIYIFFVNKYFKTQAHAESVLSKIYNEQHREKY